MTAWFSDLPCIVFRPPSLSLASRGSSHLLSLQVLNMYGKLVTVRHQAVNRKKDNRFAVALDSEQNNIHVKDIVKVIDGPHSVRSRAW